MMWNYFYLFALPILLFWLLSVFDAFKPLNKKFELGQALLIAGGVLLSLFIVLLWISLERPPLRTLGETRIWYAFFLPLSAILVERKWKIRWIRVYCLLIAIIFIIIELLSPDSYDKTLMPALQSPWFIPHVIVYIVGYAFLGASSLSGFYGLYSEYRGKDTSTVLNSANLLVVLGFVFLTLGLLFGGFWAKEAWGHYWTWDPKETWAFLTWITYLIYLHIIHKKGPGNKTAFTILALGFVVLMICWFGLNYFVSPDQSVHTYSN